MCIFQNKSDDYLYLYTRNLENSRLKPVFWYTILIWGQVDNTKWILCKRIIGVKCAYLRFLIYKVYFEVENSFNGGIHDFR
jgi:hypothetical protein